MRYPISRLPTLARGLASCCLASVLLVVLLGVGACSAALIGIGRASAETAPAGLDVVLVIDQSQSLYELGGTGSDPDGLRQQGARLVARYLGADTSGPPSRLALVYFGTEARLALPLTPLSGSGREAALAALDTPPAMGWTDVDAALATAAEALPAPDADRRRALLLFTDGRPQTDQLGSPAAEAAYLASLRQHVAKLTDGGTTVFVLLLRNAATDADPYLRQTYRPFWISLAETDPGVRFYDLRQPEDLPPTYHDIVAGLRGHQSAGAILRGPLAGTVEATVTVKPGWGHATFVVHKSEPAIQVRVLRPDGRALAADASRVAGDAGDRQEIWPVDGPEPGTWIVRATGHGAVTVWLDYQPAAAPAKATVTPSPSSTATARATATVTAAPTRAPAPSPAVGRFGLPLPPAPTQSATPPQPAEPSGRWAPALALGAAVLALLGGATLAIARPRRRHYALGSLRRRAAPAGSSLRAAIDLSAFHAPAVTLGGGPHCDLVLEDDPPLPALAARIALGPAGTDAPVTLDALDPAAGLRLNDRPVTAPTELFDRDEIQLGGYRLGYENLSRRRPPARR